MAETTEQAAEPEAPVAQVNVAERQADADSIISKYMGWGAGAGAVPLPIWDLVAIGSVQVMMLKELYALYGVSFSEKKARSTVTILLSSVSPKVLVGATASTLLKFVPVVGPALATVSLPLLSSAVTYATGRLMVSHLECGGTQENFDAEAAKSKFAQAVEKGKEVASNIKNKVTPDKPATA